MHQAACLHQPVTGAALTGTSTRTHPATLTRCQTPGVATSGRWRNRSQASGPVAQGLWQRRAISACHPKPTAAQGQGCGWWAGSDDEASHMLGLNHKRLAKTGRNEATGPLMAAAGPRASGGARARAAAATSRLCARESFPHMSRAAIQGAALSPHRRGSWPCRKTGRRQQQDLEFGAGPRHPKPKAPAAGPGRSRGATWRSKEARPGRARGPCTAAACRSPRSPRQRLALLRLGPSGTLSMSHRVVVAAEGTWR